MANRISVPDNTEALHAIGEYVMQYEAMQNAYLTALVNRIGMTIITSKMWDNPWSVFKKGRLEFLEQHHRPHREDRGLPLHGHAIRRVRHHEVHDLPRDAKRGVLQ